jgi:hypothetical protein
MDTDVVLEGGEMDDAPALPKCWRLPDDLSVSALSHTLVVST